MKKTNTFRKASSITVLLLSAGMAFTSCKKESNSSAVTAVTDDEVAEVVTQSVSASSGGMVTQTEATAEQSGSTTLTCGASSDTTVAGTNVAGASVTYNYSLNFSRSLVCANGVPSQFNASFTGSSSYAAALMSSADNSNAQITVTGIQPSASVYTINETYTRNGTQQSKVRLQRSLTTTITITGVNITISKATGKIMSGTATVEFTGSASGGASVSRGGSITFKGNGQATLSLNNGGTYELQW